MSCCNLIEVKGLKKYFKVGKKSILKAVDNVTLNIKKGETLGLVGESGCGKTTLGRTILGVYKPTDGQVLFEEKDINKLNRKEKKEFMKKIQIIFQDPYSSLNPRMTVMDIIGEGIDINKLYTGKERKERIYELLNLVGLNREHAERFPHEFSGGQRQRVVIARALSIEPEFIVCDEPISALDVSIQAQIVNLLIELQNKLSLTYLFITHNLSIVKHISDRIGVMYLGSLVEIGESNSLYENPLHPYTKALLSSISVSDPKIAKSRERVVLEGEVPNLIDFKEGCKFASRCRWAKELCREKSPQLKEIEKGHFAACHLL